MGVVYSNKLSFDEYIEKIVATASAKSNCILRAFQTRDMATLLRLFYIYVRPLLEYCTPLWSPTKQSAISKIENVQKRFTKQVFVRNELFDVPYNERLTRLGATSLSLRRIIYDQNLVHKIVNDRH